jgi:hypothetical protein
MQPLAEPSDDPAISVLHRAVSTRWAPFSATLQRCATGGPVTLADARVRTVSGALKPSIEPDVFECIGTIVTRLEIQDI